MAFQEEGEGRGQRGSEKTSAWFSGVTATKTELGSLREEKERPSGGFEGRNKKEREREKDANREARAGSRQMR